MKRRRGRPLCLSVIYTIKINIIFYTHLSYHVTNAGSVLGLSFFLFPLDEWVCYEDEKAWDNVLS